MLPTHQYVTTHENFAIYLRQPGFEYTPVMLAKIASYIARRDDGHWAVFAFMYSLLAQLDGASLDEEALLEAAIETIKARLDAGQPGHRAELTFEFRSGAYREVIAPRWWIATA